MDNEERRIPVYDPVVELGVQRLNIAVGVLLAFRKHGDTPETRKQLETASRVNPFVLPLLTGRKQMPPVAAPAYSPGSEDEAVLCVQQLCGAWLETPGAIEWIEDAPKVQRKAENAAKRKQQRKGKKS